MKKSFKWILSSISLSALSFPLIATSCPKKTDEQDALNTFANNYASNVVLVNKDIDQNKAMDKGAYNMPGLETGYEIIDWNVEKVGEEKVKVTFKIKNKSGKTSKPITKEFSVKKSSTSPGGEGGQQGGGQEQPGGGQEQPGGSQGGGEQPGGGQVTPEEKKIEIIDEGEQTVSLQGNWKLDTFTFDLKNGKVENIKENWQDEIDSKRKTVFYSYKEKKIHGKTNKGQKPWDGEVLMRISNFPFDICAHDKPLQEKPKNGNYNTSTFLKVETKDNHYLIKFRLYDFKNHKISKNIYAIRIAK
ncbi:variable surface lipoprotein [Metamycoplasma hyosynoviae]|uniref:variable surface lipoprotein n=1 Tax=Metamycoplasma hyosynoviae TaxID=29559 RepID=UPI0020C90423|nr:variable surface lipoprotein [Metamycoplasma hyosynoviae]UTO27356.1 variable surface lipoprotein [Metamycoplasma hyosynoviae]